MGVNWICSWLAYCQQSPQIFLYPSQEQYPPVHSYLATRSSCPCYSRKLQIPNRSKVSRAQNSPLPQDPTRTADSPTCLSENPSSLIAVSGMTVRLIAVIVPPGQSARIADVLSIRTFSCRSAGNSLARPGDPSEGCLAKPSLESHRRLYEGANVPTDCAGTTLTDGTGGERGG